MARSVCGVILGWISLLTLALWITYKHRVISDEEAQYAISVLCAGMWARYTCDNGVANLSDP
mgnify:CR=1 FL=1